MALSPAMQKLMKHGRVGPPAPPRQSIVVNGVTITKRDMVDYYVSRAMKAYARSGGIEQPAAARSTVCDYKGRRYVRLANVNGPLAVYRITHSIYEHKSSGGMPYRLRRLKKWHKAIFQAPEPTGIYF